MTRHGVPPVDTSRNMHVDLKRSMSKFDVGSRFREIMWAYESYQSMRVCENRIDWKSENFNAHEDPNAKFQVCISTFGLLMAKASV